MRHSTKQARPAVRLPTARAAGVAALEIVVDSQERYGYTFKDQQATTRRARLPAGDYGVFLSDGLAECQLRWPGVRPTARRGSRTAGSRTSHSAPCTSHTAPYGGSWTASSHRSGRCPERRSTTVAGSSPSDHSTSNGTCRGSGETL